MGKSIFINYRRDDEGGFADAIHLRLEKEFGEDEVFRDQGGIDAGADFKRVITDQVSACDLMLAVIGPKWLNMKLRDGTRRIDSPGDFVRFEIEQGMAQKKRVIPVRVNGAAMPQASHLPTSIRAFALCNAVIISNDKIGTDCEALFSEIRKALAEARDLRGKLEVRAEWRKVLDVGDPVKMRAHLSALAPGHWLRAEAATDYERALAGATALILRGNNLAKLKAFAAEFPEVADHDRLIRAIATHPGEVAWLKAKDADTAAAVRKYLLQYPGGVYSDDARALLKKLEDRERWQAARDSKDPIKLKEIAADSNSAYAGLARQMLDPNRGTRFKVIGAIAALLLAWVFLPDDFKSGVVRALTGSGGDNSANTGGRAGNAGSQTGAPADGDARVTINPTPMAPAPVEPFPRVYNSETAKCPSLSPAECIRNSACIYSVDTGSCQPGYLP